MTLRLLALVCCAAIAVGACGGSGSSKSSHGPDQNDPQACSIVAASDVNLLFGHPAGRIDDVSGSVGAKSVCIWKAETDPGSTTKNVSYLLQVRVYPHTVHYSDQVARTATKVDGVGEKAYVQSLGTLESLTFVKKDQTVTIAYSINGFGGSVHAEAKSQRTALTALAKQAAARM